MVKSFKIFIELLSNVNSMSSHTNIEKEEKENESLPRDSSNSASAGVGQLQQQKPLSRADRLNKMAQIAASASGGAAVAHVLQNKTPEQIAVENAISTGAGVFKEAAQRNDPFAKLREWVTPTGNVMEQEQDLHKDTSEGQTKWVHLPPIDRGVKTDKSMVKVAEDRAKHISALQASIMDYKSKIENFEKKREELADLIKKFESNSNSVSSQSASEDVLKQLAASKKIVSDIEQKVSQCSNQITLSQRLLSEVPRCDLAYLFSTFMSKLTSVKADGTLEFLNLHNFYSRVRQLVKSLKSSETAIAENNALPKGKRKPGFPTQPMTKLLDQSDDKLNIESDRYSPYALSANNFKIVYLILGHMYFTNPIFRLKKNESTCEITVSLVSGDVQPTDFEMMSFFISLETTLNQILASFNEGATKLEKPTYTLETALSTEFRCATIFVPKMKYHFSDEACKGAAHSSKPVPFTEADDEIADKIVDNLGMIQTLLMTVRDRLGGLTLNSDADLNNSVNWAGKPNMEAMFKLIKECGVETTSINQIVEFLSSNNLISRKTCTIKANNGKTKLVYPILDASPAKAAAAPAPARAPAPRVLSLKEQSSQILQDHLESQKIRAKQVRIADETERKAAQLAKSDEYKTELAVLAKQIEYRNERRAQVTKEVEAARARLEMERQSQQSAVSNPSGLNAIDQLRLKLQGRLKNSEFARAAAGSTSVANHEQDLAFLKNVGDDALSKQ